MFGALVAIVCTVILVATTGLQAKSAAALVIAIVLTVVLALRPRPPLRGA